METLRELTLLKTQVNEIAASIDRMIAHLMQESGTNTGCRASNEPYESVYSLTETPTAFFKGKKPSSITLPGNQRKIVRTWKQVAVELLKDCIADPARKAQILALRGVAGGRNRSFIAATDENMRSPEKIDDYIYLECHYDTETLLHVILERILAHTDYDSSSVKIALANL